MGGAFVETSVHWICPTCSTSPQAPKADVYGLLLPDSVAVSTDKPTSADNTVQLRQPAAAKDVKGGGGVAMRHGKKLRNRKSAVYGGDADEALPKDGEKPASADDMETSPIHNMNVKLVSLSPESSVDRGDESSDALLETRQGKVSDLVKQFEEEEEREGERKAGNLDSVVSSAEGNLTVEGTTEGGREKVKRRKPSNKAFDVFERSGIIMGMVSRRACSLTNRSPYNQSCDRIFIEAISKELQTYKHCTLGCLSTLMFTRRVGLHTLNRELSRLPRKSAQFRLSLRPVLKKVARSAVPERR